MKSLQGKAVVLHDRESNRVILARLVETTLDGYVVEAMTYVRDTGRWGEFMAGKFADCVVWEAQPADQIGVFPRHAMYLYSWGHSLPTKSR